MTLVNLIKNRGIISMIFGENLKELKLKLTKKVKEEKEKKDLKKFPPNQQ